MKTIILWLLSIPLFAQTFTNIKGPLTTYHDMIKDDVGTIYLASHSKGVFKSTDEGQTWVGFGGTTLGVGQVNALAFNNSGQLLGATEQGGVKVWDGTSWTAINTGIPTTGSLPIPIRAIAVDATGNYYAGAHSYGSSFTTSDLFKYNGSTWSSISAGLTNKDINTLVISPITNLVYAGTDGGGIFIYNGSSWSSINLGLSDLFIHKLTFASNGDLFAGTNNGLFKLSVGTNTWLNLNIPATEPIQSIIFENTNNAHILVGTGALNDQVGSFIGKIYQTSDAGTSWTQVATNIATTTIRALLFSSTNTFIAAGWGVARSTDNGQNWTVSNTGLSGGSFNTNGSITVTAYPDHHIFYGTNEGVFKSIDGGLTWQPANNGLTRQMITLLKTDSQGNLFCSAMRYLGTGSVAFGDGILYKSKDDGNTWTPVNIAKDWRYLEMNELLNGDLICSHGFGSGPPIATIVGSSLAISHDHGTNWTDLNVISGLGYSCAANAAGDMFVAGESNGVFRSTDAGNSFQLYALPALNSNVGIIEVSPTGDILVGAGGIRTLRFSTDNGSTYTNFTSTVLPDYRGTSDIIFDNTGKAFCTTSGQNGMPSLFTVLPPFSASSTFIPVAGLAGSYFKMVWDDCGYLYIYSAGNIIKSTTALNVTTDKNQSLSSPLNDVLVQEYSTIAATTIISTNKVLNSGIASYSGKNTVLLDAGFEAQSGSTFKASIVACGN